MWLGGVYNVVRLRGKVTGRLKFHSSIKGVPSRMWQNKQRRTISKVRCCSWEPLNALRMSGKSVTEICLLRYYVACFFSLPRRDASLALSIYIVASLSFYGTVLRNSRPCSSSATYLVLCASVQYARSFNLKMAKQRLPCLKLTVIFFIISSLIHGALLPAFPLHSM